MERRGDGVGEEEQEEKMKRRRKSLINFKDILILQKIFFFPIMNMY